jgi:hypothetical protein
MQAGSQGGKKGIAVTSTIYPVDASGIIIEPAYRNFT